MNIARNSKSKRTLMLLTSTVACFVAAGIGGCSGGAHGPVCSVPFEHLSQAPVVEKLTWPYLKLKVPDSMYVSDTWIEVSVETEGCRRIIFSGRYTPREMPGEHVVDMQKLGFTKDAIEWLSVWWKDPDGKLHKLALVN